MGGEDVAGGAGDDVMMPIAGGGDRSLTEGGGGIVMQPPMQLRAPVDLRGKLGRRELEKQAVRLARLPKTAGQPAIPSAPMKPTSIADPSAIRTNSDSAPVSGK